MEKIDFVIPWVDGNDLEWQKSFRKYLPECKKSDDAGVMRYRDWDNLRYWFRGVEKFAPWVNKIHFITCGQIPDWLNLNAPKLHWVRHSDYIPKDCLPTFSANPIELNMHRIEGLSEHFVYFNDDFFLINKVSPTQFFRKGLPCDMAVLDTLHPCGICDIIMNDLKVIDSKFNKKDVLMKNPFKWFNFKYGMNLFRTLALLPWPYFSNFYDVHSPNAFLKSTFEEVWAECGDILNETTSNRFRSLADVNQYLFRFWQLAKGRFMPKNIARNSIFFSIEDFTLAEIVRVIRKQEKAIIILNEGYISSFEDAKEEIRCAFESIFPEKSDYEL